MRFNVLVVDDSAVMRRMIRRTLHLSRVPLGDVHEAENGAVALGILGEEWIDLALVDINMPVLDGEQFIRRVRADPENSDLAIVVVSTESSESRIQRLHASDVEFVHKPFTPEALRGKILEVIGVDPDDERTGIGAVESVGPDF